MALLNKPISLSVLSTPAGARRYPKEAAAFINTIGIDNTDLVTNGTFTSDTGWTKGSGWTIAAGVADTDGTASSFSQEVAIFKGLSYRLTFNLTEDSSANDGLDITLGGSAVQSVKTTGAKSLTFVAGSTDCLLKFIVPVTNDFNGKIDNVVLKEVLP